NTVVVIEHNLDVIKTADWIVDIGPEAGVDGGMIVAQGTPEEVVTRAEELRRAGEVMRSWTGELLKPVIEEHELGDLELFDARAVAKKRKGDVDIARVGRDAAVPWKVDGRKWHTQDRPARSGRPVQWEGAALGYVVDLLEEIDGLKETNWNDQRTVEITAEQKTGTGWFFHALTGDEWFVRLYFRVPKKTFDADELQHRLGLTPVDEIDEIPVYGRGERVKVNNTKGPFQEVVIDVHERDEIDTPEFRKFVLQAAEAYLRQVRQQNQADPADVMPWKVLGRKWHESRKGFPSNKRVGWSAG